jgi:hypothetical protein
MKPTNIDSVLTNIFAQIEAGNDPIQTIQAHPAYADEIQDFLLFQSLISSQSISVEPSKKGLRRALKSTPVVSTASLYQKLLWKRVSLMFKIFTPILAMSFLVVVSLGGFSNQTSMYVAQIEAQQQLDVEIQRYRQDQSDFEALQQKLFMPKNSQKKSALIALNSDYNS